jgi:hypothetical protein
MSALAKCHVQLHFRVISVTAKSNGGANGSWHPGIEIAR